MAILVASEPAARADIDFDLGGFAQANVAGRISRRERSCPSASACDVPLGEVRLQLKLEASSEDGLAAFSGKVDLFHDAVADEPGIEVRETYLDLTWKYLTFRIGRQIITWGVGDLLFVNDLFPKDWVAFFTGRPLQYLKVGSDAMKIGLFPKVVDIELVVSPFFAPDRYPMGQRLLLPDPFPPGLPREVESKKRSAKNIEVALKVSRAVADWTIALYGWRTFHRLPAMAPDDPVAPTTVRLFFPRLNALGASASGALLGGVLSVEGAFYDSQADRLGTDPAIENSQARALIGYTHALWKDATIAVQGYLEWMLMHEAYRASQPPGFGTRDERRWIATLRFTQRLLHQTLTLNLFAFWGINEQDAYLIPSVRYAYTDELWAELGGNLFFGRKEHTMFGALDDNDSVYLAARYSF